MNERNPARAAVSAGGMARNVAAAVLLVTGTTFLSLAALDWVGYFRFLLSLVGQ